MIAHNVVKELGLKIEQASSSLIVSAIGTSTRPLGIIKDLSVEIEGVIIPITVEVVPATSYSLLLGNDWSRKLNANYNWANGATHLNGKIRRFLLLLPVKVINLCLNNQQLQTLKSWTCMIRNT